MKWTCSECDALNDEELQYCPECGELRVCESCGGDIVEAERKLKAGSTQTMLECENCHLTKHRIDIVE